MRYPVIGFAAPARSGKDTAAAFAIAAVSGYKYSFADPMRAMILAGFGINPDDPYWQARKEEPIAAFGGKSLRYLLQTLGTEWGRELVDDNLWITLAKQQCLLRGPGMVVADVRYENEASWIRSVGGAIIHIDRPNAPQVRPHKSEAGLFREGVDFVITNDGTLEDLQEAVRRIVG